MLYDCFRVWGSRVWQAILKSQQGLHPYKIQARRGEAATNLQAFFSQTLHFRGLWSWLDVLAIFPSLLRMIVFVRTPMQWLDRLSHMRELYTWSSFSYAGNLFDDWWCIRYVAVCIEACKNALCQEALPTFLRKLGVGASREKSWWVLDGFFDCSLPSLKPMPVHLFCELVLTCLLAQSIPKPSTSTPVYNKF